MVSAYFFLFWKQRQFIDSTLYLFFFHINPDTLCFCKEVLVLFYFLGNNFFDPNEHVQTSVDCNILS